MSKAATAGDSVTVMLGRLRAIRRTAVAMLFGQRAVLLAAGVVGTLLVCGLLDYLIRLPNVLRGVLLVAAGAWAAWGAWRWVIPAARFRPSLTQIALRVEGAHEGGLKGLLASSVDFSDDATGPGPLTAGMRRTVIGEATQRLAEARGGALLKPRGLALAASYLGAVCLVIMTLGLASPDHLRIGARRILTPWAEAAWPKRTRIEDITERRVHALGTALVLRAALAKTDQAMGRTTVAVRYRLVVEGAPGPAKRQLMTSQNRRVEFMGDDEGSGGAGELYERLLEPGSLGVGSQGEAAPSAIELEYWFETADDATGAVRVALVEPPRVLGATAAIELPEYLRGATLGSGQGGSAFASGEIDLGPGSDSRAAVINILAGSTVDLRVEFNKPVIGPARPEDARVWAREALGDESLAPLVAGWTGGDSLPLAFVADKPVRMVLRMQDSHGLTNADEAAYSLDVLQDRAATASILEPVSDESVLATAVVPIRGEGRDDARLAWVGLERQLAKRPEGSSGGPAEAEGDPVRMATVNVAGSGDVAVLQESVTHALDLGTLGVADGDEVWVTALALDTFQQDGQQRPPTRSPVRRLRVISEDELVGQIRSELAGVRQSAMRTDEEQAEVAKATARDGATPENRSRQAAIGDRLRGLEDSLRRLQERADRNRLEDDSLAEQFDQGRSAARDAAQASQRAGEAMNTGRSPDPNMSPQEREQAQEAQDQVRDELTNLIEMLDRGEDSWLVRRELERLLQEQRAVTERTRQATQDTTGKPAESLTPQERAALQDAAQRQEDLARRAEEAISDLRERSEQMRESDPVQAEAMAQAAQSGQQQQIAERMRQASQQAQQNQGENAAQLQEQAQEAMEEMLDELRNAEQNRDQALRRVLSSIIESISALISSQDRELAELARSQAGADVPELDVGMVRLRQNTLGVSDTAATSFRELERVAELLGDAATAQAAAITALRADPRDLASAQGGEEASLQRLKDALEEAQRQDQAAAQRELDRQRRQLRQVYREVLEQQIALREETGAMADKELTRKQRTVVRRMGERQEELRARLSQLREATEEIRAGDSLVAFAHDRLDALMGSAAKALGDGEATSAVLRTQDSAIRVLQALLKSLDENQGQEQQFQEQDGQQQNDGPPGENEEALIPPIAELRLLRDMQQEAADATRDLDASGEMNDAALKLITDLQTELATQGRKLLERLSAQQQGGRP